MTIESSPSPLVSIRRRRPHRLGISLALLFVAVVGGSRLHLTEVASAEAANVPASGTTSPAKNYAKAVPAVTTQATTVFAKGVEGLSPKVLAMALDSMACARAQGASGNGDLLTVIDYSLPSTTPRLWVLDLKHGKVLFNELVAHGRGSGDNYATSFSNLNDSHQSSLGLYLTRGTYNGGNGYSLVLKGLDEGVNDRAEARHIVMHGAWYVSADHARQQGRLGRSWGCPALSQEMAPRVIDTIKGGTFLFAYAGQSSWLETASNKLAGTCGTGAGSGVMTASTR